MRSRTIRKRRLHAIEATRGNTRFVRQFLLEQQGWRCAGCDRLMSVYQGRAAMTRPEQATLDHIHPRSRGGTDGRRNLQMMCRDCNCRKGNTLPGIGERQGKKRGG